MDRHESPINEAERLTTYREALERIAAYWNGHTDEGAHEALVGACEFARETATAALRAAGGNDERS